MKRIIRNFLCAVLAVLLLVPAQAAFADNYAEYQTEHFTLLLPSDWQQYEAESTLFVLPPDGDAYEGVYLRIAEIDNPVEADEYDEETLMNIYASLIYGLGNVVQADPYTIGDSGDFAVVFTAIVPLEDEEASEETEGESEGDDGAYISGVAYIKDEHILLLISQDVLYNEMMYTYMIAYEFAMARLWYTADGRPQSALHSYADYDAAETGSLVTIEACVEEAGDWSEDGISLTLSDDDGTYRVQKLECAEDRYENLVPGMKLLLQGTKTEQDGQAVISDAWFDFLPCTEVSTEEAE